jgi:negative regulator of replication initiation
MLNMKSTPKRSWKPESCTSCNQSFRLTLYDGIPEPEKLCPNCRSAPNKTWVAIPCPQCSSVFRWYTLEGKPSEKLCQQCLFEKGKTCPICGVWHQRSGPTCSSKHCVNEAKKATFREHYGVDNVFAATSFQETRKTTLMAKYGVDHQMKAAIVKERAKETIKARYGVENPGQAEELKEKMRATCEERYGVEYVFQDPVFKAKAKATNVERYGVPHHAQTPARRAAQSLVGRNPVFRAKSQNTLLIRYGVTSPLKLPLTRLRSASNETQAKRHETMKRNGTYGKSLGEDRLFEILQKMFPETRRQERIGRWSIDFYIPEKDTYINFNGDYWHGRGRSESELLSSVNPRDAVILGTQRRDAARRRWFLKQSKRFIEVWESDFCKEGEEMIARIL